MRTLSQLVGTGFDKKLPLRFECTDLISCAFWIQRRVSNQQSMKNIVTKVSKPHEWKKKNLHIPELNRLKQATKSRRKWRILLGILLRLSTRWSFASLLAMKWTDGFVAVRTMGSVTDKHIFILEFCFLFKMISSEIGNFRFCWEWYWGMKDTSGPVLVIAPFPVKIMWSTWKPKLPKQSQSAAFAHSLEMMDGWSY